jgi:hypothetical protein
VVTEPVSDRVRGYTMLLHALATIPVRGARSRRRARRICTELLKNYYVHELVDSIRPTVLPKVSTEQLKAEWRLDS